MIAGSDERPSAIFAASDALAVGALKAFKEADMEVPEDISLVGLIIQSLVSIQFLHLQR